MFSVEEKKYILDLARRSIAYRFSPGGDFQINEAELPSEALKEKRSCFVTLTLNGHLRGCIGHVEAVEPLYLDIIENAAAAAFDDPRFDMLTGEEFKNIEIEVSVLTPPVPLKFSTPEELLGKLRPGIDGVILREGRQTPYGPPWKGGRGATYLPQVWENLKDKEEFMSSLSEKAGLEPQDWKKKGAEVFVYQVDSCR